MLTSSKEISEAREEFQDLRAEELEAEEPRIKNRIKAIHSEINELKLTIRQLEQQERQFKAELRELVQENGRNDGLVFSTNKSSGRKRRPQDFQPIFVKTEEGFRNIVEGAKYSLQRTHSELLSSKSNLNVLKGELMALKAELVRAGIAIKEYYIQKRNEYSITNLRRDYANCLREIESAVGGTGDAHLQTISSQAQSTRDYDAIAQKAQVFCVSSKAHQDSLRRRKERHNSSGPKETDITGISQLKKYCISLTENPRLRNATKFLDDLSMLLNSISLWISEKRREALVIQKEDFELLEKVLRALADTQNTQLNSMIDQHIGTKFGKKPNLQMSAAARVNIPANNTDIFS